MVNSKDKVLEIAIMLYISQGCEASDMTFNDFYDSNHPAERACIYNAVLAYNIATNSEFDVDDMRVW